MNERTDSPAHPRANAQPSAAGEVVAVMGAGSMAGAVATAMLTGPAFTEQGHTMRVTTRSATPEWAATHDRVELTLSKDDADANRRAARGASTVMLGVRPEHMQQLVDEIADDLEDGAVVLSIAAAITLDDLEQWLPQHVAVVRAMPNLPVDIGEGVTAVTLGSRVTDEQADRVTGLLQPTGELVFGDEAQLDVLTAVSGAGPAYVSYLIEGLIRATVEQGVDEQSATSIAHAIVRGSIARLDATDSDAAALRAGMMHPGNITDTSMRTLDAQGVMEAMSAAVASGVAKARGN